MINIREATGNTRLDRYFRGYNLDKNGLNWLVNPDRDSAVKETITMTAHWMYSFLFGITMGNWLEAEGDLGGRDNDDEGDGEGEGEGDDKPPPKCCPFGYWNHDIIFLETALYTAFRPDGMYYNKTVQQLQDLLTTLTNVSKTKEVGKLLDAYLSDPEIGYKWERLMSKQSNERMQILVDEELYIEFRELFAVLLDSHRGMLMVRDELPIVEDPSEMDDFIEPDPEAYLYLPRLDANAAALLGQHPEDRRNVDEDSDGYMPEFVKLCRSFPSCRWFGMKADGACMEISEAYAKDVFHPDYILSCTRHENKYVPVPAGATRDAAASLPRQVAFRMPYQQGEEDLCVPLALANALAMAAFTDDATCIFQQRRRIASKSSDPLEVLRETVRSQLPLWTASIVTGVIRSDHGGDMEVPIAYLNGLPDVSMLKYPCVIQLLDHKLNAEHSVGLWDGCILDPVEANAMRFCRSALDHSTQPNRYKGIYRMLILKPAAGKDRTVHKVQQRALAAAPWRRAGKYANLA